MSEIEATFGFIDLAGFTALTEAHGDDEAVGLLDRFERLARGSLGPDDRLVKTIGDAAMFAFANRRAGVEATGRLFQACLAESGMPLPRAGLHHGVAIGEPRRVLRARGLSGHHGDGHRPRVSDAGSSCRCGRSASPPRHRLLVLQP
jgi:class 3 adenylate cyclase